MDFNPRVSKLRRFWEPLVGLAALATLPMLFIERNLEPGTALIANSAIWFVFTAEFLTIFFACEGTVEKKAWMRESVLDILIIVGSFPVLPSTLQSFRLLRIGRASRLVRFLRIGRIFVLGWLLKLLARKFRLSPAAFSGTTTIIAILIGANALHILEPELIPDLGVALWWAVTTVTTVGYGDFAPTSEPGRVVASLLMVTGIASMAAFSSALTSYLVRQQEEAVVQEAESHILEELRRLHERLDGIESLLPKQCE